MTERDSARCGLLVSADASLLEALVSALGPGETMAEVVGTISSALTRLAGQPTPAYVLLDCDMADSSRVLDAVRAANEHVELPLIVLTCGGRMTARTRFAARSEPTFEPFAQKLLAGEVRRLRDCA